jgi:hypothetical protein
MAWTPPGAGELRHRVKFYRRPSLDEAGEAGDGAGNFARDLTPLCTRDVQLLPLRGGEEVIAGRSQGVDVWTLVVRSCSMTRRLRTDDVAEDERGSLGKFNIRSSLDLEGRGDWLVMTLERGKAVG